METNQQHVINDLGDDRDSEALDEWPDEAFDTRRKRESSGKPSLTAEGPRPGHPPGPAGLNATQVHDGSRCAHPPGPAGLTVAEPTEGSRGGHPPGPAGLDVAEPVDRFRGGHPPGPAGLDEAKS